MSLTRKFVHLTHDIDSLNSILRHGLLIRARRRNVWKYFIRRREFRNREPQQFGMTCVHSYRLRPNGRCVENFGAFGLGLAESWLIENNFRNVIYIREHGLIHLALQTKFNLALKDLDERMDSKPAGDAFPRMAYTNLIMAGFYGAREYCNFLDLFQYMEPHKHKHQSEWRYCRSEPYYNQHTVEELRRDLDSGKGWTKFIHLLKFSQKDVTAIYLPKSVRGDVKGCLFAEYADKPIIRT